MAFEAATKRRWIGGVALAGAIVMLLLGETALQRRLSGLGLLAYWMGCFGLTGLAIAMAFLDVRMLHHRTRKEQRELFDATLRKIVVEAENKPRRAGRAEPGKGARV